MSRVAQLRKLVVDYDDTPPQPWKPKPGDCLVGEVLDLELRDAPPRPGDPQERPPVLVVTMKDEEGTIWAFWAWHKVARGELAKVRPAIGDTLAIRRLDDVKDVAQPYARYVVFSDSPEVKTFSWDDVDERDDGAPTDLLLPKQESKGFARQLDEDEAAAAAHDPDLPF